MSHLQEKKNLTETTLEGAQMLKLLVSDVKSTALNVLNNLKKTIYRELKKMRFFNNINSQFFTRNYVDKKAVGLHIKSHGERRGERKPCQPRILYLEKLSFKMMEKLGYFFR